MQVVAQSWLVYERGTPRILVPLLLAMTTSVFGRSYQQLLPVFARDILLVDASGPGIMLSARGAGTIVGALALSLLGDVDRKGVILHTGMCVFSVVLVLFTVGRSFVLSLGLLLLASLVFIVSNTMLTTLPRLNAPAAVRGGIMSLVSVVTPGFVPAGARFSGSPATFIRTALAVGLWAAVVGTVAVVAALRAPVLYQSSAPEPS